MAQSKTYAMLLGELCTAEKAAQPVFDYKQLSLTPSVFRTTCQVTIRGNTYRAVAEGRSKKEGKQKTSELMMKEHLKLNDEPDPLPTLVQVVQAQVSEFPAKVTDTELSTAVLTGNPINDLNLYCDLFKSKLPLPEYKEDAMDGQPHKPLFCVHCTVGRLTMQGYTGVKQRSKRVAADKVLVELKNRYLVTGSFGDATLANGVPEGEKEKPTVAEPAVETESIWDRFQHQVELAKQKLLLEQNNEGTPRFNMPFKHRSGAAFADDGRRKMTAKLVRLGSKIEGPSYLALITFSSDVDSGAPLDVKPAELYKEWLSRRNETAVKFFLALKDEMNLEFNWVIPSKKPRSPLNKLMVGLSIEIPGITDKHPYQMAFADTVEEGKELAALDIIVYIGLMSLP